MLSPIADTMIALPGILSATTFMKQLLLPLTCLVWGKAPLVIGIYWRVWYSYLSNNDNYDSIHNYDSMNKMTKINKIIVVIIKRIDNDNSSNYDNNENIVK